MNRELLMEFLSCKVFENILWIISLIPYHVHAFSLNFDLLIPSW